MKPAFAGVVAAFAAVAVHVAELAETVAAHVVVGYACHEPASVAFAAWVRVASARAVAAVAGEILDVRVAGASVASAAALAFAVCSKRETAAVAAYVFVIAALSFASAVAASFLPPRSGSTRYPLHALFLSCSRPFCHS